KAVEDLNLPAVVSAYFHIVPLGEVVLNSKDHWPFAPVNHCLLGHHDGVALRGMDHRPGIHTWEEPAAAGELEGDLYQAMLVRFGVDGGYCSGDGRGIAGHGVDLRLLSGGDKADIGF